MKQQSLGRVLGEHALLAELAEAHREFLAGCSKNVRFGQGDYLFREGQEASELLLVRRGKVALEVHAPADGVVVLETLHAGDVVGWSTIFPPYRFHHDARAFKDTLVFAIDGACLRRKLEADPSFGFAFTRIMLREAHRRMERLRLQQLDLYRPGRKSP